MNKADFVLWFHKHFHFSFRQLGIYFDHRDYVAVWLYPWRRTTDAFDFKNEKITKGKYYSMQFFCTFTSLKRMDEFINYHRNRK
jgi:hypothetical protein